MVWMWNPVFDQCMCAVCCGQFKGYRSTAQGLSALLQHPRKQLQHVGQMKPEEEGEEKRAGSLQASWALITGMGDLSVTKGLIK